MTHSREWIEDGYEYNLLTDTALIARLAIFVHALRPACPEIRSLHFTCPTLAPAELPAYFSTLERTLLELNGISTPLLVITCPSKSLAADLLEYLRSGNLFPVLFGQRRSVHVAAGEPGAAVRREFTAANIVASFRPFAIEGERVTLDKAQRVEWLLRKQSDGSRKAYVRMLVLQARAKAANEGAS
ncbi:hypothetical protein PsYK624_118080 [Phanerochaete sordida]|uniref:Uncharacterized protein n=1 Tax=Phanerochaete sordida TaxID=48140 RepID=A0A9P3LIX0_9APHY|nr:hypothetical protein PsYK624_118080 [Phanerochaete sordida]